MKRRERTAPCHESRAGGHACVFYDEAFRQRADMTAARQEAGHQCNELCIVNRVEARKRVL